jgi:hypothetical protein
MICAPRRRSTGEDPIRRTRAVQIIVDDDDEWVLHVDQPKLERPVGSGSVGANHSFNL